MTAIIDYGAGNLFSVKNALDFIGTDSIITSNPDEIRAADRLILPGVGAFPDAMRMLYNTGLVEVIKEQAEKKPLLGICLGMQLLFDESDEFELTQGLGLISGKISRIKTDQKIPHMGYNELEINHENPILCGIKEKSCVYFVHSYMAYTSSENVLAYCDYTIKIPALVARKNIFGAQFHPEKSGEAGLRILSNFERI